MLAGCATSPGKLSVSVTDQCLRLPGGTASVNQIDESSDGLIVAAEALSTLELEKRRNRALKNCFRRVVKEYSEAGQ